MAYAGVVCDDNSCFFAKCGEVAETCRLIDGCVRTSSFSRFGFIGSREDDRFDASVAKRLAEFIEVAPVFFFAFVTAFGDRCKDGVAFRQADFCG